MKEFNALTIDQRAQIVWEGNFLLNMEYYEYCVNLYVLPNNRLAEVWYSGNENDIVDIRLTEQGDLQKWLNRIELFFA